MITEAAVHAYLKAYEMASETRDFSQVAEMIHPDATYRFNDGDFIGLAAIRGAFEQTWSHNVANERYWLTDVRIIYSDSSSACVSYDYHWSGLGPRGPFEMSGRGTQLLVQQGDRLQCIYEHLGAAPDN